MDLSRRNLLAAFGAGSLASLRGPVFGPAAPAPAAPAPVALPAIDAERIGRRIVSSLQPAAGERAILVYDPHYYPEIAEAIQAGLRAAGANPVVLLTFDPPAIVRAEAAGTIPAAGIEERTVAFLRPLFDQAAMFLWLPTREISNDTRWEHLVAGSRARGIHFHWILPLEGHEAGEVATLSRMYERAILETDYAALSREQDRLIAALRGRSLRITDARGTDLRLRVPDDAWFHKNDGDVSPSRGAAARCARDREMEFPSGALRFIPDVPSAEGRLVVSTPVPRSATRPPEADTITLEFERGRAVRRRAAKDDAAFARMWDAIGGDIDKVGEIVIGTNPLLAGTLPSGTLPYYGYGEGHVRVSMGDNWESGGANRSPSGRPLWLFLEKATVESGGRALVKDGRLVQ
jgi:Thermophilic metalloprotease (M29)